MKCFNVTCPDHCTKSEDDCRAWGNPTLEKCAKLQATDSSSSVPLHKIVSSPKALVELEGIRKWKEAHGFELTIGVMVKVKPSCVSYEAEYDQGTEYVVTYLYVDSGGLNIGMNDGSDEQLRCDTDGYRWDDLEPILKS